MYLAYDKKGKVEYAKVCISKRIGKTTTKDYIHLGRVVDKKKGIYKNRERGVFLTISRAGSYDASDSSYEQIQDITKTGKINT